MASQLVNMKNTDQLIFGAKSPPIHTDFIPNNSKNEQACIGFETWAAHLLSSQHLTKRLFKSPPMNKNDT